MLGKTIPPTTAAAMRSNNTPDSLVVSRTAVRRWGVCRRCLRFIRITSSEMSLMLVINRIALETGTLKSSITIEKSVLVENTERIDKRSRVVGSPKITAVKVNRDPV